jgi:hypothetical protein
LAGCTLLGVAALLNQGCSTGCDDETVDRAVAFIDAHQSCVTDDDCVVIRDFCEELPGGYCGQLGMNREGAESTEWRSLTADLQDCAPSSCSVCDGGFALRCTNNVCGTD